MEKLHQNISGLPIERRFAHCIDLSAFSRNRRSLTTGTAKAVARLNLLDGDRRPADGQSSSLPENVSHVLHCTSSLSLSVAMQ